MADAAAAAPPRLDPQNPWPGLAAFTEDDRAFFRGREAEADELARLVRRERLTVLFGRSGLGKSSLINAGLFPRLREDLHLPVYLRIGYGALPPRQQLWDALAAACDTGSVQWDRPRPDETPWAFFHRAGAGFWNPRRRPLRPVLVFDQFEELFTVGQADEASRAAAAAFVDELADLVEDRPSEPLRQALEADPALAEGLDFERRGCKVVISFREDFLAEMEGLKRRMPSLMRNRFRLLPMDGAKARAVIASGGDLVVPEVAGRIVGLAWRNRAEAPTADEAERVEVDPALLSVICSELNLRRRAAGRERIEPELLAGAETAILADFYERSFARLPGGPREAVRRFVEDELITAAGFRDSFAFDDAVARPGVERNALLQLVASRLLRIDERFGVRRLELTHDVLTRVVKDSRDARRAREAEAAALAREQEARERQARVRRRERRLWAWAGLAVLLAGVAVGAGYWAAGEIERARADSQEADRRLAAATVRERAASEAQQRLERLVVQHREVAEAAARRASDAQRAASAAGAEAQRQTELARQRLRDAQATDLIVAARTTPADQLPLRLLLGAELARRYPERVGSQVELLARLLAAHRTRRLLDLREDVLAATGSGDGRELAVVTESGQLVLVRADPLGEVGRWSLRSVPYPNRVILAGRARVALVANQDEAYLVRLEPGSPAEPQKLGERLFGRLVLSADGERAAKLLGAGGLELWSTAAGAQGAPLATLTLPQPPRNAECASFDVRPGHLVIGDLQASWFVELASGRVERRPLAQPAFARSADCRHTLWLRGGQDAGPRALVLVDALDDRVQRLVRELGPDEGRRHLSARFTAGDAMALARLDDEAELWPLTVAGPVRSAPWSRPPRLVAVDAHGGLTAVLKDGPVLELARSVDSLDTTRFALPQRPIALVASADGGSLVGVGEHGVLQSIRLGNGRTLERDGRPLTAQQIEFNAAGTHLGLSGGGLSMWDLQSGRLLPLAGNPTLVEFSPDGRRYAAASRPGGQAQVTVFELAGAKELDRVTLPPSARVDALALAGPADPLAIAAGKELLLHGGRRGLAQRIPLAQAARQLVFLPRQGAVAMVLDDGSLAAHALADGGERWRQRARPGPGGDAAHSLAASPDGAWLVAGRSDGEIALHDPSDGRLVSVLRPAGQRREYRPVSHLAFVGGRAQVVAAGELDGPKHLYDLQRREWLGALAGDGDLKTIALSPGGYRLALRHADDTVSLRAWDPPSLARAACNVAGRNLNCAEWWLRFPDEPYRRTCDTLPDPVPACRRPTPPTGVPHGRSTRETTR